MSSEIPLTDLAADWDATSEAFLRERGGLKWADTADGVIPAWVAEMDFGTAPSVVEAWREAGAHLEFGYPASAVGAEMADATARWYSDEYGWAVDPTDISPIADVVAGLQVAITEFSAPGAPVIVPTPAYMPFLTVPKQLGRDVIEVPLLRHDDGRFHLDLAAIDRELAAGAGLVILANPGNPTGTVYSRDELIALAEVVDARGGRVFSDEIHAPLTLFGNRHVPLASVSEPGARVAVTATSASKAWNLPGLKCAQLILSNDADRARWAEIGFLISHGASTPGMRTNTAAYRDGREWLAQVRSYLEGNVLTLHRELAARLPRASVVPMQATYLAWIDLSSYQIEGDLAAFIEAEARVRVVAGTVFGQVAAGHLRLNLAMPRPILIETIDRIGRALSGR